MSLKTEAIKRFLTAAKSLADQGMSKEAIEKFARNEFGQISELFQKQIDSIFKMKSGIGELFGFKNFPKKDEVFDDTVIKLPIDDTGQPFNPKDPLKDYSKKPRDEKYTGGIVDVEPNLSDIGHGSDALMSRTRLMSPGSQATTSTGLNYLLAEDNDNIRVPFSKGKIAKELLDKGRRGFMKTAGSIGAGIAGLKAGLLGFGDQAAPVAEDVIEKVVQNAESVPPYFLNLVKKIKNLGARSDGYKERSESFIYKDYNMDIDYDTGAIEIKKTKESMIPGGDEAGVSEEVYMTYKPGMADETTKGKKVVDQYEEYTARPDMDGKMKDVEAGVTDEVIEEGTMFEDNITDFKKAEGGRIGYSKGKAVLSLVEILKDPKKIREAIDNIFKTGDYKMDAEMAAESLVELNPQAFGGKLYDDLDDKTRMQVYGAVIDDVMKDVGKKIKEKKTDTYKFLEKVFGKENMSEMPNRDPLMYEGLKEVVPMFRQKDKARKKQELIMYMQKYLPHMDDAEIEAFIKGSDGTEGLQGQLIRLGSGRDYAEKMEMMNNLERNRSLRNLEVTEEMKRKPNASGGLAKLLGE